MSKTKSIHIGIVGCGAIGSTLARSLVQGKVPGAKLIALWDRLPAPAASLARDLKVRIKLLPLLPLAQACDLLVEAAGISAVPEIAQAVLKQKKDLLVMSIGALIEHPRILQQFHAQGCRLHFPSGAVAGLDALKAAAMSGKLQKVTLTTRKPAASLCHAPFFQKQKIAAADLRQAATIFSGSARQAIRLFPANVNVAAAVALLGLGPDRTRVKVIADPHTQRNQHVLEFSGSFGKVEARTENVPFPSNPQTSFLAALSALELIRAIIQAEHHGT